MTTFLYAISKKRTRSENCMHFCEGTGLKIAHRFARGDRVRLGDGILGVGVATSKEILQDPRTGSAASP